MALTEKTLIPLGLAVVVIGGGAVWMTKQDMQTSANAARIEQAFNSFDSIDGQLREVLERLGIIEGELRRIKK